MAFCQITNFSNLKFIVFYISFYYFITSFFFRLPSSVSCLPLQKNLRLSAKPAYACLSADRASTSVFSLFYLFYIPLIQKAFHKLFHVGMSFLCNGFCGFGIEHPFKQQQLFIKMINCATVGNFVFFE